MRNFENPFKVGAASSPLWYQFPVRSNGGNRATQAYSCPCSIWMTDYDERPGRHQIGFLKRARVLFVRIRPEVRS